MKLSRILRMDFAEFTCHALRSISLYILFATHSFTASSDKNHSFGGCAGCLEMLPFQGSGKEG